jgi:hypothetical protein
MPRAVLFCQKFLIRRYVIGDVDPDRSEPAVTTDKRLCGNIRNRGIDASTGPSPDYRLAAILCREDEITMVITEG